MKKNPLYLSTLRKFKLNSIFFQYFKMFLGVVLIPTVIVMIIYISLFYKNTAARVEKSFEHSFAYVENAFSGVLDETGKLYQSLVSEPSLQNFMNIDDILKMTTINKRNFLNNYEFASTYISSSKYLKSISIYSKNCGYVLDPNGNNYEHRLKHLAWLKNQDADSYYYFIPVEDNKDEFYICYNYLSNNSPIGIIAFRIDMSDVRSYINTVYPDKAGIVFADANGKTFYEFGNCPPKVLQNSASTIVHGGNSISLKRAVDRNTLAMTAKDSVFGMSDFILSIFACVLIAALIALLLSLVLSFRAHSIINKMILKINTIEHDNIATSTATDEIIYLTTNIINIVDRNKALESELLKSVTSLNNMQFQMLQMQFSPHFLFNVLNTLHMYLLDNYGIDDKVSNIIVPLCDILTDSLNTNMYMVTIEDEINYTRKYLELQNIMSGNSFTTHWDIDDDTLSLHTVKLTIQPLVENALKHGIKPLINRSQSGTIDIAIRKKEDMVEFTIINDGPPVDLDELAKLQEALDSGEFPSNKNIGLKNVNKRIQLIYGNKYGCRISNDGKKTTVKINVPIVENI